MYRAKGKYYEKESKYKERPLIEEERKENDCFLPIIKEAAHNA